MKKAIVAGAIVAGFAMPALAADYYIVQDQRTHECHVVSQKPQSGFAVIGSPFTTQIEAESQLRKAEVCHGATTGSGAKINNKHPD